MRKRDYEKYFNRQISEEEFLNNREKLHQEFQKGNKNYKKKTEYSEEAIECLRDKYLLCVLDDDDYHRMRNMTPEEREKYLKPIKKEIKKMPIEDLID